jgi:hypothetical protein
VTGPDIAVATTIETGSDNRIGNMQAFALAALTFLRDVFDSQPAG